MGLWVRLIHEKLHSISAKKKHWRWVSGAAFCVLSATFCFGLFLYKPDAHADGKPDTAAEIAKLEKLERLEYNGDAFVRLNSDALRELFIGASMRATGSRVGESFRSDGTYYFMGGIAPRQGKYWITDNKLCCKLEGNEQPNCYIVFTNSESQHVLIGLNPSYNLPLPVPITIRKISQ